MKFNGTRIVYDDAWEDELGGYRFIAGMLEDEGNLSNIQPQADNIPEGTWKNVLKLREFFENQLEYKYKRRKGKQEILRAFQAKRLFEGILTLFLGGYEGMKRSQDQCVRRLERKYGYMIRELHATLTMAPNDKDDLVLPYEDIVHNNH